MNVHASFLAREGRPPGFERITFQAKTRTSEMTAAARQPNPKPTTLAPGPGGAMAQCHGVSFPRRVRVVFFLFLLSSFFSGYVAFFDFECSCAPSSLRIAAGRHLAPRLREHCGVFVAVHRRGTDAFDFLTLGRGRDFQRPIKRRISKCCWLAGKNSLSGGLGRRAGSRGARPPRVPPVRRRF